jgi:CBS domain-containing protein
MTEALPDADAFLDFARNRHPFALLPAEALEEAAAYVIARRFPAGGQVHAAGETVEGLWFICSGHVTLTDPSGADIAHLGPGEHFGAREALRDAVAAADARAHAEDVAILFLLPRDSLKSLVAEHADFARAFSRSGGGQSDAAAAPDALLSMRIRDLMTADPITIAPDSPVRDAARIIRDRDVSCLPVVRDDRLIGILTTGDLADRVIAEGLPAETLVGDVMTPDPMTVDTAALGYDALVAMTERRITHLPVVEAGRLVGVLTGTNLVKRQAVSAVFLVADIAKRDDYKGFAEVTARIPTLLAQLVGAGVTAYDVGRIVTSIADALTRRLLTLGEAKARPGAGPVALGGLRQPGAARADRRVGSGQCAGALRRLRRGGAWRLFRGAGQIRLRRARRGGVFLLPRRHDGDGGSLAPAGQGVARLFRQVDPPARRGGADARLRHVRPARHRRRRLPVRGASGGGAAQGQGQLDLPRAYGAQRAEASAAAQPVRRHGDHPLGRAQGPDRHEAFRRRADRRSRPALCADGELTVANTRDRLIAGREAGVVSGRGADDLIDAYDLIADMRLEHQARLIREGRKPDNFMPPAMLSELERGHLKNAFAVIKTMQSSAGSRVGL